MNIPLFLLLHALATTLALEHDYFASYYGNEGNSKNKWVEPDGVRRQDTWPPSGSKSGPPNGESGPESKYGDEIYWGPNPPSFGDGYPSHYPPMATTTTTTPAPPPPKDTGQRVSKKPYSYYFLGRKLWYIPLYFAIYYTIYVGALIVKAIARHRVNLPAGYGRDSGDVGLASMVGKAIQEFGQRYM